MTVNVTWYYCSGNHCGLHGGGGPEDGLDAVAAAAGGGLPELRQRLLDVVDALQRHVRPWHQRRAPHDDGAETGGLPCGDVARAVVKEHRSLGVELGDLDDGFHGRQRGLAQDRPSTATVLLGLGWWWRVQCLEADDPLEAVLEAELLQDSGRVGLVGVGEDDLPLRQGKQQLPKHRVRLHLLVRQRPVHAGVEVVVVETVPQNLEAGHCGPILPVQVQAHPGDLALLDPQLVKHVLLYVLAAC